MSKKKRRPDPQLKGFGSQSIQINLSKAQGWMRRQQFEKALDILEPLNEKYPAQADILLNLASAYYELQQFPQYQIVCTQLQQLKPNDPDLTLMLAGAYLSNVCPVLAFQTFQDFLTRWPDHPRSREVQDSVTKLQGVVNEIIAELSRDDTSQSNAVNLEIAALHETAQFCLQNSQFTEAQQAAEKLLTLRPNFIPDLNNLSLIYGLQGELNRAITVAQQVLKQDPDNVHALSNLSRFHCLNGELATAQEFADRLKASSSNHSDRWLKQAEALSFLGDDQGILDALQGAEQASSPDNSKTGIAPLLYHLAAVASLRLNNETQAYQYWHQAIKLAPNLELAQANLQDMQRPLKERQAPWAYTLHYWISPQAMQDVALLQTADPERGRSTQVLARQYLEKHPDVAVLLPLLLDRGDLQTRQFAMGLALMADTPEMKLILRDFALSQRGSDAMRQQAAQVASEAGLFPPGFVRMWLDGEWHELTLLGFELHDDVTQSHSPEVDKLGKEAIAALKSGEPAKSERLLKKALKLEPNASDVRYNLAGSYQLQDRTDEALALVRQIHQDDPDYLFARIGLARHHLENGETAEAEALLQPLMSRRRFHYKEFDAFCAAQMQLYLAQNKLDAARSWLDMWTVTNPDTPAVEYWRSRLNQPKQPKQPKQSKSLKQAPRSPIEKAWKRS